MAVPLFDPSTPLEPLRGELDAAIARVLDSKHFILGPEVEAFEAELAAYVGAQHALGVANGTEALTIALRALGVGPGDDVVVPSFTFYASAEAIPPTGARPVFCDVDPETFTVTADTVKAAMTRDTKAVIAVHLFGNVAPIAEIEALGVPVIEDAAQSLGSTSAGGRPGSLGTLATLSFYPSKNLGAFGDGGAVTTSDPELATRLRSLRDHGRALSDRYLHDHVGVNSRLDALQAGILSVKLRHLDGWTQARRAHAAAYREQLPADVVTMVEETPATPSVHHLAVVRTERRQEAADGLALRGIDTGIHYPVPCHLQEPYAAYSRGPLPVAESAASEILSLPMFPHLTPDQVSHVCESVAAVLR